MFDDIEILNLLFNSKISVQCVGDVKQSTYTTYNAKKNKKVTGTDNKNINIYERAKKRVYNETTLKL